MDIGNLTQPQVVASIAGFIAWFLFNSNLIQ